MWTKNTSFGWNMHVLTCPRDVGQVGKLYVTLYNLELSLENFTHFKNQSPWRPISIFLNQQNLVTKLVKNWLGPSVFAKTIQIQLL